MTVEPEEEKAPTTEEDVPAAPLPQKEIVSKEQTIKPKRKVSPTPAATESNTFMDKLKEEKKKLDMKSKGAKKIDFKLKEVDPYAESKA